MYATRSRLLQRPVAGFFSNGFLHSHVPSGWQMPWREEMSALSLHVWSMPGVHTGAADASEGSDDVDDPEDDDTPAQPDRTRRSAASKVARVEEMLTRAR